MKTNRPRLSYYSYDSLGNPWLSGGGALRDFEVLQRQKSVWEGVTVYTGSFPGFRDEEREGIRYRALGWGSSYALSRVTFTLLANLRVLLDGANAIGNSVSIYAPLLTGLLRPKRFYLVAHHYVGRQSQAKFGFAGIIPRVCEWALFRFCRALIVSNGSLAARVRALNPKVRLLQSQNGFDTRLLDMAPETAAPPFILFLGRYDIYMKGLDLLLRAFGGIQPVSRGAIRLVLAGKASPETLAAVETLAKAEAGAGIELLPNISEDRKMELLRTCLFFCSPSRFEGWGIAALEANAAGKAALVTETDGFRDSLAFGETALAVPTENLDALRAGMIRLIEDVELRESLGRRGRERAKAFSWAGIAQREGKWIKENLRDGIFSK